MMTTTAKQPTVQPPATVVRTQSAALSPQSSYHTRTWLLWLLTAGLAALLTRNPLYLVLIMLAARSVDEAAISYEQATAPGVGHDPRRHGWTYFFRMGLILAAVSALFNGLGAHLGATVLLALPADWPIVGGPLTLEGFVYGALAGLAVLTVLLVAGTFNVGADTYALLRTIPAFLSQAGLVTAIGLAYVPQTIVRLREIYEAQQLRGHRFRGLRSALPLVVPLLAGGLDRAIQLAEAMESRGFARRYRGPEAAPTVAAAPMEDRLVRPLLIIGTAGVALGAFGMLYFRQTPAWGAAALAGGLAAIGLALWRLGRLSRHTRYRREIWRRRDSLVALALLVALAIIGGVWVVQPGWWAYSPYPALAWPDFQPLIGVALALLAAPALPLLGLKR